MEKIIMNELQITGVRALQILDSRGYPTVKVWLTAADGTVSVASAPSGASTGAHEGGRAARRRPGILRPRRPESRGERPR